MRRVGLNPLLWLLAIALVPAPAEGQAFGPATWIRQAWANGHALIPMDIEISPEEEVFVTGHLLWYEDGWFEASADSLDFRRLQQPPDGSGFLVRYDGGSGDLGFVQSGSMLTAENPYVAGDYSAGYSVEVVDGQLFHGEGIRLRRPWNSGSGMITVRDPKGLVLQRIGPRERSSFWVTVLIQGTGFDAHGNLYLVGTYSDTLTFSPDAVLAPSRDFNYETWDVFLASYTPGGMLRWARQVEDGGTAPLWVSNGRYGRAAFDVDAEGTMVLGAVFHGLEPPVPYNESEDGAVLASYDREGNVRQVRTLRDLGISYRPSFRMLRNHMGPHYRTFAADYVPHPSAIRLDQSGNLFVLWRKKAAYDGQNALTIGNATYHSRHRCDQLFVLAKFDPQGTPLWARNLEYDWRLYPSGLEITDEGNVYVYGAVRGHFLVIEDVILAQDEGLAYDGFVAQYDENGNLVRTLHAAGSGDQHIEAVAVAASGDVYIAGRYEADMAVLGSDTLYSRGENNAFVAKYSATSLPMESSVEVPPGVIEVSNYPNPFRHTTIIAYRVPVSAHVRLSVYDILGREIAVLVDEVQGDGQHSARVDASAWPSGVYLYRLETGNQAATGRLVRRK